MGVGNKGVGENTHPTRVLVLWEGGHGGLPRTLHAALGGHLTVGTPQSAGVAGWGE